MYPDKSWMAAHNGSFGAPHDFSDFDREHLAAMKYNATELYLIIYDVDLDAVPEQRHLLQTTQQTRDRSQSFGLRQS